MTFTIQAFVTFFTIIDPLSLAPISLALLSHYNKQQRNFIINRAIIISAIVIASFGLIGRVLLERLGINLYAFNIAGGILLFLIAIDMLFGRAPGTRETLSEEEEAKKRNDISVFPLAIPMIAGPGTLATTILFADMASSNPIDTLSVIAAITFSLVVAWIVMKQSFQIVRLVGRTGILVFSRILGMILAALAAQIVINGISTFIHLSGFLK